MSCFSITSWNAQIIVIYNSKRLPNTREFDYRQKMYYAASAASVNGGLVTNTNAVKFQALNFQTQLVKLW